MAAFLGAAGVAIGAFGAHGLKDFLIAHERLDTFETAVKYQFYHALALFFVGLLQIKNNQKWLLISSRLFVIGILIFSGSLYMLCLTQLTWLGIITPVGGILLIGGWLSLLKVSVQKPI